MKLEDLQTSISEMSDTELEELLRSIRHNRTSENVVAKKEKQNKEKKSEIEKLLAMLSPEQLAQLLTPKESIYYVGDYYPQSHIPPLMARVRGSSCNWPGQSQIRLR